jgi:uncharacterized protein (TIGR02266 family)
MSDRRRFPRVEMCVDVDVLSNGNNFFVGRTRDISIGGLFIESNTRIDIGTTVGVKVRLDGSAFHLTCRVAWTLSDASGVPTGHGVEFLRLPLPARRAVEAYMIRRAPELFEAEAPRSRLSVPSRIPRPRPRQAPPPLPPPPRSTSPGGADTLSGWTPSPSPSGSPPAP